MDVFYLGIGGTLTSYGTRFGTAAEGVMSMGGINTADQDYQEYRAKYIEVTGGTPDFWNSPVIYAGLEILQQAIENTGSLDLSLINEEIRTGTFDTVVGSVSFTGNVLDRVWTVGQWHDGIYRGVNGVNVEGTSEPFVKPGWK